MKATKRSKPKETEQRLLNIENSLREIQSYLNTSKLQLNNLNQVVQGIEEIKQNTKKRGISLFPPKLSSKPPKPNVTQQVTELLQNPVILNMLLNTVSKTSPQPKSKAPTKANMKKSTNLLTNVDWTSLLSLLQSPAIHSLFNTPSEKTRSKRKPSNSNGIDIAQVMKLIQDPAIQSMINKRD